MKGIYDSVKLILIMDIRENGFFQVVDDPSVNLANKCRY